MCSSQYSEIIGPDVPLLEMLPQRCETNQQNVLLQQLLSMDCVKYPNMEKCFRWYIIKRTIF